MINALIGLFIAIFNSVVIDGSVLQMSEKHKIEYLIESIQKLEGAKFYRNGEWYTPAEAAGHLRMKLNKAGNRIKTARQFIDKIASESSMTGNSYKIKFKDGKILESKVYLDDQLAKIAK